MFNSVALTCEGRQITAKSLKQPLPKKQISMSSTWVKNVACLKWNKQHLLYRRIYGYVHSIVEHCALQYEIRWRNWTEWTRVAVKWDETSAEVFIHNKTNNWNRFPFPLGETWIALSDSISPVGLNRSHESTQTMATASGNAHCTAVKHSRHGHNSPSSLN